MPVRHSPRDRMFRTEEHTRLSSPGKSVTVAFRGKFLADARVFGARVVPGGKGSPSPTAPPHNAAINCSDRRPSFGTGSARGMFHLSASPVSGGVTPPNNEGRLTYGAAHVSATQGCGFVALPEET